MKTLFVGLLTAAAALLLASSLRHYETAVSKTAIENDPKWLLPREVSAAPSTAAAVANDSALPAPSSHWIINYHGQCCEGNLAAQGPSTYVLLPILVTGNQIWRSDDNGKTWTQKYPPANASIPFGIEGDLNAFGNDVVFFGTEVALGVAAHSSDRGENWTVVQIPVAFAANDQAWGYMGPFSVSPAQTAPYVMTGWYRIGSVALFSLDGGLTWPIQTPLPGVDGSGSMHVVCEQTAHDPTSPGDTRIADQNFVNHKAGHYGCWGTDKKFYWTEPVNGNLYVCKSDNFGATWTGIKHPIAPGPGQAYVTSHSGFDNNGTLYVLHGDKLYVSFNQGESFAFVHTLPRYGNAGLSDSGADHWFVVNCGTIHVGLAEAGDSGNTNVWYLRGSNVDTATPTWDEELVDVVGNDRLDFFQIIINGNGIPTLSYTTPGTEVTTASRDAPMPPTAPSACVPSLLTAVSRKTHGTAGTFDIPLPLTGTRGVECRSPGQTGTAGVDYKVVFTFAKNITNCGSAGTTGGSVVPGPNANQCTENLTGIPNGQYTTVSLVGVVDAAGSIGNVTGPQMGLLVGDVNASGVVTSGDTNLCKAQALQSVTSANFRNDINASGAITTGDVNIIKQNALLRLPTAP
jgi:BNR-Asp box repeat